MVSLPCRLQSTLHYSYLSPLKLIRSFDVSDLSVDVSNFPPLSREVLVEGKDMADVIDDTTDPSLSSSLAYEDLPQVSTEEFKQGFGEDLHETLDLNTWFTGENLDVVYSRIEAEVREAVAQEEVL